MLRDAVQLWDNAERCNAVMGQCVQRWQDQAGSDRGKWHNLLEQTFLIQTELNSRHMVHALQC